MMPSKLTESAALPSSPDVRPPNNRSTTSAGRHRSRRHDLEVTISWMARHPEIDRLGCPSAKLAPAPVCPYPSRRWRSRAEAVSGGVADRPVERGCRPPELPFQVEAGIQSSILMSESLMLSAWPPRAERRHDGPAGRARPGTGRRKRPAPIACASVIVDTATPGPRETLAPGAARHSPASRAAAHTRRQKGLSSQLLRSCGYNHRRVREYVHCISSAEVCGFSCLHAKVGHRRPRTPRADFTLALKRIRLGSVPPLPGRARW
jgi:hypothetical protein